MIKEFVEKFEENKEVLRKDFLSKHPSCYQDIVESVVKILKGAYICESPDPDRIHQIDDGDYQGTLLYLIASSGYQPSVYWYVFVSYGSCSGCDTLESIRDDSADKETQIDDLMTLALHIVQGLKKIGGWDESI